MGGLDRFSLSKALTVAAVAALAAAAVPAVAEAQARGTLQATATVVETRHSFAALEAARSALQAASRSPAMSQSAVATVAQLSIARPATHASSTVVLTIDYSRN